ncbi:hypothetical protein AA0114_g5556 [Alternaria tenuissima]|uniref:Uncharacterized protein n=1 Tax=Alternaria tenuissima TaxID=119927 RepID=A0A4Q4MIX1_9PLEO|nr:hypothetical protein AA0114_g5556 [Alternaria tenuissima]
MAREKRIAHKSQNSLSDANRDITSAQAKLIRNQNTHEHRQALVNSSVPEETLVSVGFAAQIVDEAQKSKCQADLEKARSILDRRQKGQPVSWVELEWTKTLCAREAKLEGAEIKDLTATDMEKQQWQQDQERKIQEISAANKHPTWTTRMLLRARLGEGDKSDSVSDSDLSNASGVSGGATPEPARVSQKKSSAREPEDDNGGSEKKDEDNAVSQAQPQDPLPPPMSDANNNMTAKRNADEDSDVDIWDDNVWALMIKAD